VGLVAPISIPETVTCFNNSGVGFKDRAPDRRKPERECDYTRIIGTGFFNLYQPLRTSDCRH